MKLESKGQRIRTLYNPTRLKHAQFAAPALPTVRSEAENKLMGSNFTKPRTMPHGASYHFPPVKKTTRNHLKCNDNVTVLLSKPLEFPMKSADIAFTVRLTYKLYIPYETFSPPYIPRIASSIAKLAIVASARQCHLRARITASSVKTYSTCKQ